VERAAVPAAGRVAAGASRQPGNSHDRRPAEAEDRRDRRALQGHRRQLDPEPRARLRVPARVPRR
jgi:hypothetical protein